MPDVSAPPSAPPAEAGDHPGRPILAAARPHLVGVAGTGMSSLATLLAAMGKQVSGSDAGGEATLARLARRGVRVARGHAAARVADADVVVRSAAVPADNPELREAGRRGIPIVSHAEALGALMATRRGIAIAGTHGKSTTTALVAHVLATAGRDPTMVGGAESIDFGDSSCLGQGPEFVAEADEYDRRFLQLRPEITVITGVEVDHLDSYRDLDEIRAAFRAFVDGMPARGTLVTCADEPNLEAMSLPRRRLRYGAAADADWRLSDYRPIIGGGCYVDVAGPGGIRQTWRLRLSGWHNALNAAAAAAVGSLLGIGQEFLTAALATFQGTRRRFETKLRQRDVWIVDDYAHHPTAVRATLRAARDVHQGPIWAIFQPHTVGRTIALLDEFAAAFSDADHVVLTPIYRPAGREESLKDQIESDAIAARTRHPDVRVVASLDAAMEAVAPARGTGALVITLGAGDVTSLSDRLAEAWRSDAA